MAALDDLHMLLVDDNAKMRHLLRCLLRAGGVSRISEAGSVAEALNILGSTSIGLLLVDWKMQPIDGLAFTRMLRQGPDSPNAFVPILMLTAHTEASRVAAARDAGVTGFVKKPISARVLFERVNAALTDTRDFVRTADFFGPDRRHGQAPNYNGPLRRAGEPGCAAATELEDTLDI